VKKFAIYCLLVATLIISGCAMRVKSYDMDRVDQEIRGNRGVLKGTVPDVTETESKKTRRVYNLEVEMPSLSDFKKSEGRIAKRIRKDTDVYGNRGYICASSDTKLKAQPTRKRSSFFGKRSNEEPAVTEASEGSADRMQNIYVVKKGDTLQKISKEFYGTTKRWKKIYEANMNTLKGPDFIKKGQKLVIPMD